MIEKNDNIKIINKSSYLLSQLIRIWDHLSVYYKRQYILVSILMVFATLVEVINLGAVVPFLGIITAPDQFFAKPFLKPFINFFQISEPNQLRLPLTILFIFSALFSSIIRSFLIFSMNRLSFSTGTYLSIDIYRRTLYQDYSVHVSRNSSEVINGIISKTSTVIHGVISPVLVFISYFVQLIIIITAVFLINYTFTLIIFFVFGTLYLLIIRVTSKKLKKNSSNIANQSTQMIKALQEGLGGIRDIIIDGSQRFYCNLYGIADASLRKAQWENIFISSSPLYVIEFIGITFFSLLTYNMSLNQEGLQMAIPILAVAHDEYKAISKEDFNSMLNSNGVLIDVKSVYEKDFFMKTNINHWRL